MADRTLNGLRGCISSLDMTIRPCAEQASDTLAREQVALMTKYLAFVSKRVALIHDRVRYELGWYLKMGADVSQVLQQSAEREPALADLCDRANALLTQPGARQIELAAVSAGLRSEVSRIVRMSVDRDRATRRAIEAIVIDCSRPLIEFERAWFAPQGWESNFDAVPDLQALLAVGSAPNAHRHTA